MHVYACPRESPYSRLMFTAHVSGTLQPSPETDSDQLRTHAHTRRLTDMHKASDSTTTDDDQLLTSDEVAKLLGYQPGTLRQWRTKGRGPRYLKQPGPPQAPVRYRAGDVEEWRQKQARAADPATWQVVEPE